MELMILVYIVKYRDLCVSLGSSPEASSHYRRQFLLSREAPNKIRPVLTEMMRYVGVKAEMLSEWEAWEPPKFPLNGHQLQQAWSLAARDMRPHLLALRSLWVDSECTLTAEELLSDNFREKVKAELPKVNDVDSDLAHKKVKRSKQ